MIYVKFQKPIDLIALALHLTKTVRAQTQFFPARL